MIYYTINHYVTTDKSTDPFKSSVHGDGALCVWESDDYATTAPDYRHDQSSEGWTWRTDLSGWDTHPDVLDRYVSDPEEITRVDVWDTSVTDGQ